MRDSSSDAQVQGPHLPDLSVKSRSLFSILYDGVRLYWACGRELTLALVIPILLIVAGAFAAPFFPIYTVNYVMAQYHVSDPMMLVLLMGLFSVPGFYFFFLGFWEYMVYLASFNRSIVAFQQGNPMNVGEEKQAVKRFTSPYTSILTLYALILLVPLAGFILPIFSGTPIAGDWMHWLGMMSVALALGGVLSIVALVFSVYCCLPIQILAMESEAFNTVNPLPIFKRSAGLVKGHFWRALIITIAVGAVTTFLIPTLVSGVLDLLQITKWISKACIEGLVTDLVRYTYSPDLALVRQFDITVNSSLHQILGILDGVPGMQKLLFSESFSIVSILSQVMLSFGIQTVVASFLTPLGSIWYCLLYEDLVIRQGTSPFSNVMA